MGTGVGYDKIIIGAGLYGLYSARLFGKRGERVLVLEYDAAPCMRATYINQARVHMGYHYPRSYATARKTAQYYDRFVDEFGGCINSDFDQIYATSSTFSWTNAQQFSQFCRNVDVLCDELSAGKYFKAGMCDGAFLTKESTFDARLLRDCLLKETARYANIEIVYNTRIKNFQRNGTRFELVLDNGSSFSTEFVVNAAYASINQILSRLSFPTFKIKYELCEIILCKTNGKLGRLGITVMDGPFFSIMPFGKTEYHSLTSVTFTPHLTCYDSVPVFACQGKSVGYCSPTQLGNCNQCPAKPQSAWRYMSNLARKFLRDEFEFDYVDSLFSVKPTLVNSEIDDSRPTLIKQLSSKPTLVSVLSGKISTVYDLEEVLTSDLK
jgi:hypothetical protein